tara:strand:+ start:65 stop:220 length:156 start_codon:yes stop_codon:yes gene_type:complete
MPDAIITIIRIYVNSENEENDKIVTRNSSRFVRQCNKAVNYTKKGLMTSPF